jgi:hypothetical protein
MFNVYGCRRGNHEVMMRGTFANIRIRNAVAPGTEGGVTKHYPTGQVMSITRSHALSRDGVRSSSSPARNTALAPRATGPPKGRGCSACAPSSLRASSASTART